MLWVILNFSPEQPISKDVHVSIAEELKKILSVFFQRPFRIGDEGEIFPLTS